MRSRILVVTAVLGLALAACGGGSDGGGGGSDGGGSKGGAQAATSVDISEFTFKPGTLTVAAGTTVTWTNRDGFAHSVKPDGDAFPASPVIDAGKTYSNTFAKPGTYPYICGIHNSMTGTIVVK